MHVFYYYIIAYIKKALIFIIVKKKFNTPPKNVISMPKGKKKASQKHNVKLMERKPKSNNED